MKYLAIIFRLSMIAFFFSLILTLFKDNEHQKYLISAACIVTAALSIRLASMQR